MPVGTEYVSNDILNGDLGKIFSPFHQTQFFLGVCRVNIKNKFVTPPSALQKLYTCLILVIVPIFLMVLLQLYLNLYGGVAHLPKFIHSMLYLQWVMFMCHVVNIRFFNNDKNVNLFLRMHKVDRLMRIDKNKFMTYVLYRKNRNTVLALIITILGLYVIGCYGQISMVIYSFGVTYIQVTYMLEFLHFSCIMFYFCLRIRFLNAIILNHLKPVFIPVNFIKKLTLPTRKLFRRLAADTHDFVYSDVDTYLKDLLNCFYHFQDLYRYQMLIFFLKLFFSCLLYVQFIIVALKDGSLRLSDLNAMVSLLLIDAFLISLACIRCEIFFREAKLTRCLSISLISIYCDGPLRQKAKRILQTLEEHPPVFSVYHMWNIKGDTIVQLTGVMTTIFFTLLQFNYL